MTIGHPPHWHSSWKLLLSTALNAMDNHYLQQLQSTQHWLPGNDKVFNAFSLPLHQVRYILFGESPYPRQLSANGYAFWDNQVTTLWSPSGLSKATNRATSLRNMIKMLLVAEGKLLPHDVSAVAISKLNKDDFIQTLPELFKRLLSHGFLLLNASLAWHNAETVKADAKQWQPFIKTLLNQLYQINPHITLILWGNIARQLTPLIDVPFPRILSEHPYNISFIHNQTMQHFFAPLHLLVR